MACVNCVQKPMAARPHSGSSWGWLRARLLHNLREIDRRKTGSKKEITTQPKSGLFGGELFIPMVNEPLGSLRITSPALPLSPTAHTPPVFVLSQSPIFKLWKRTMSVYAMASPHNHLKKAFMCASAHSNTIYMSSQRAPELLPQLIQIEKKNCI